MAHEREDPRVTRMRAWLDQRLARRSEFQRLMAVEAKGEMFIDWSPVPRKVIRLDSTRPGFDPRAHYTVYAMSEEQEQEQFAIREPGSFPRRGDCVVPVAHLELSPYRMGNVEQWMAWEPNSETLVVASYRLYRDREGVLFCKGVKP